MIPLPDLVHLGPFLYQPPHHLQLLGHGSHRPRCVVLCIAVRSLHAVHHRLQVRLSILPDQVRLPNVDEAHKSEDSRENVLYDWASVRVLVIEVEMAVIVDTYTAVCQAFAAFMAAPAGVGRLIGTCTCPVSGRVRLDKHINYDCSQQQVEVRGRLAAHSRHRNMPWFRA